jgi:hypothetical protein
MAIQIDIDRCFKSFKTEEISLSLEIFGETESFPIKVDGIVKKVDFACF